MENKLSPSTVVSQNPDARKMRISWPHIPLGLIGIWLSYAAWQAHMKVMRKEDTGCGVTATIDCEAVLSSVYGKIFGVPVGLWGIAFFVIVLLTAVSNEANFSWQRFRLTQFLISCVGFASSLAFLFIAEFILKKHCTFCLRVHATTFTLFVVSLVLLLIARKKEREIPQ